MAAYPVERLNTDTGLFESIPGIVPMGTPWQATNAAKSHYEKTNPRTRVTDGERTVWDSKTSLTPPARTP